MQSTPTQTEYLAPNYSNNHPSHQNRPISSKKLNDLGNDSSDETTYAPRPQLPKPAVLMRSLAQLINDLDTGIIDVDPEYQREVVWTSERMIGLIDSLMENFYVPPIILNKKTGFPLHDKHKQTMVCVDGKQRLSSVQAFVQGMIPCHDHQGENWWFCDRTLGRGKNLFSDETQRTFLAKEFVSFEYQDLSLGQEEELFARVQMGVQLSAAEKMRAQSGPWQELAKLFVDDFPAVYALMKHRARAKDFQLTLSCFCQIVEVMHPSGSDGIPIMKANYTALSRLVGSKGTVDDGIKSHLARVWNTFNDLVVNDSDTFTSANKYLGGVQTFAPTEMVAVSVLVSMYGDKRGQQLLLRDIRNMRRAFRENFQDLRMNAHTWKFAWAFLYKLGAIRGAVEGSTVDRDEGQARKSSTSSTLTTPKLPTTLSEISSDILQERIIAKIRSPTIATRNQISKVKTEAVAAGQSAEIRQIKRQRTEPDAKLITRSPSPTITKSSGPINLSTSTSDSDLNPQLTHLAKSDDLSKLVWLSNSCCTTDPVSWSLPLVSAGASEFHRLPGLPLDTSSQLPVTGASARHVLTVIPPYAPRPVSPAVVNPDRTLEFCQPSSNSTVPRDHEIIDLTSDTEQ